MQGKTFNDKQGDTMDQTIPNTFFENFWGTADDEDVRPEIREFYQRFLDRNEKLKAEVVSYDIREDENKKKYAVYNIKVTIDHLSYTIQKRFTEFDEFRKNLKDKNPDLDLSKITFPTKTYFSFGGTSIETIEKRRTGFNDFLQLLVQNVKSHGLVDFLEFLDLKGRIEKAFNNQAPSEKQYITNTQEVNKLVEFLDLLNKNQNDSSKILQEMQTFYIDKRPKIAPDVIKVLLTGKPKSQGLVHFCGKIDPTANVHLICSVGLKFLQSLMDHQSCQDADQFIAAFGKLEPKVIAMLSLSEHIEGKRQCKGAALKLADVYLSRNPGLAPSDILQKPAALQGYETWKLHYKTTFNIAERPAERLAEKPDETEAKEEEDYSLSPHGSSMNSLDEVADKAFSSTSKLNWSTLYSDSNMKIKYNKGKYLKVSLKVSSTLEKCSQEVIKGLDYRMLCKKPTVVSKPEDDADVYFIKVKMDMPPWEHFVFVSERKIEEESTEQIAILERPARNYSVMFESTDLPIKRFSNIVIKQYYKSKEKNVKIKMLVKNIEEGSKALQDYLVQQEDGKFLIESCKKYVEDVEKKSK